MQLGLCLEMVFLQDAFEDRIRKAADLGFKNVEMWFVDGSWKGTPEALAQIAQRAGVRITNTVIGAPDGSVGGGLVNPAHRPQWLERARYTLAFNQAAGIPATIVCTGNTLDGQAPERMRQSVLDGLRATAELAEKAGITLLLEPLNTRYDHAGYFLAGSAPGAELCRAVNSPRLKLLFDCYHMQIMEGDLLRNIERSLDVIGHFHAAGVPGRHEVFQGELNYKFVAEQVDRWGYQGIFALEFQPSGADAAVLKQTLAYFGK